MSEMPKLEDIIAASRAAVITEICRGSVVVVRLPKQFVDVDCETLERLTEELKSQFTGTCLQGCRIVITVATIEIMTPADKYS